MLQTLATLVTSSGSWPGPFSPPQISGSFLRDTMDPPLVKAFSRVSTQELILYTLGCHSEGEKSLYYCNDRDFYRTLLGDLWPSRPPEF